MKQFFAVLFASLAASLVPAIAITCLSFVMDGDNPNFRWPMIFLIAIIGSFAHTLLFGLAAAGWLLRVDKFRILPMLFTGFIIGILPAAIWQYPWQQARIQSSSWVGGVQPIDDGILTLTKLIEYFKFIGFAGALGSMGSIAFYYVYKGMSPNNSFKPTLLRGRACGIS